MSSADDRFIDINRTGDYPRWLRASQIEAVWVQDGHTRIRTMQGNEYKSDLRSADVMNRITREAAP